MRIAETREGAVLEIFVKPKSRSFKIVAEGEEIVIFCTETPVKGKVNREIVSELSRVLHRRVKIISGLSSKGKRVLIMGAGKSEVEQALSSM